MKQIFCDRCGDACIQVTDECSMRMKIPRRDEQGTLMDYQYEFDLCQECSEEILKDIQNLIAERLSKGESECQTEN